MAFDLTVCYTCLPQVRTELLNGVASIYAAQKEAFDLQDTQVGVVCYC